MHYKLSPSDLTFLYNGCKRCFYLKMVYKIPQPSIPLPGIFTQIAGLLKDHYDGKSTAALHPDLPPGTVSHGEKRVKSKVIPLIKHMSTCHIAGRFDIVVSFDDGTYGVVDFKTGRPGDSSASLYNPQLHAYAYALEHPEEGALSLSPVTKLGLMYFCPDDISQQNTERLSYDAKVTWIEIEKDEAGFLEFIDEVMNTIESPVVPEASPICQWCGYTREIGRAVGDFDML